MKFHPNVWFCCKIQKAVCLKHIHESYEFVIKLNVSSAAARSSLMQLKIFSVSISTFFRQSVYKRTENSFKSTEQRFSLDFIQ